MSEHPQNEEWQRFAARVRAARASLSNSLIAGCRFETEWRSFLKQLDEQLATDGFEWERMQPGCFRSLRLSMCRGLDAPFSHEWLAIWRDFSRLTGATSVTMLESMQDGSEEAWAAFVKSYESFFENLLRRWRVSYPFLNSDEIISEINYRILTRIHEFERENWGHFRVWLKAFLRYVVLETLNGRKHSELASQLADCTSDPSKIFDAELLRHDLPECETEVMEQANPLHWQWYLTAKSSDTPWEEIGAPTGSSEVAVRKAVQRVFSDIKLRLVAKGHDVSRVCLARRRSRM